MQNIKNTLVRLWAVDENSRSMDVALLIIRIMVCACLFYHHGAEKFYDFHRLVSRPYLDPVGIGVVPSIVFAGFSDGVCSILVLLGLFSRYAAFFLLVCLNTVWWVMNYGLLRLFNLPVPDGHGGYGARAMQAAQVAQAGAQHAGQMAQQMGQTSAPHLAQLAHSIPNYMNVPLYILGFLVILIAGPGRHSLDRVLTKRKSGKARAPVAA